MALFSCRLIQRVITQLISHQLAPNVRSCIYCNVLIRKFHIFMVGLCESCMQKVPWIREVVCSVCGRYESCTDCIRRLETHYKLNRSAVEYSSEMRSWLARYKYRGDEVMLSLFVEMLRSPYEALKGELLKPNDKFDCISYVPLSEERLAERGFNQSEQLALGIGEVYRIPVIPLLKRVLHTGKQSYKTRGQRLQDLENAFNYEGNAYSSLINKENEPLHILLVDDVYTTGSTLNQCAFVIRQHLNAQIYGLTWAR